jgi:hypothetical protein
MDEFNRVVEVPEDERLRNMAALCLSVLCARTGGLESVSEQLSIQYELLVRLQELSDGNGDGGLKGFAGSSRRRDDRATGQGEPAQWFQSAVKAVLSRTGEWAYNPSASFAEITMEDCRTS